MNHGRLRRADAAKALALALVAVVGLAPLSLSQHESVVQHVRCARHGELMHLGRATSPAPLSAAGERQPALRAARPSALDEHEHCTTPLTEQDGAPPIIARAGVRAAIATPTTPSPVSAPPPGRAVLLATAPKTSPPST
jgi:hypothetical protein